MFDETARELRALAKACAPGEKRRGVESRFTGNEPDFVAAASQQTVKSRAATFIDKTASRLNSFTAPFRCSRRFTQFLESHIQISARLTSVGAEKSKPSRIQLSPSTTKKYGVATSASAAR